MNALPPHVRAEAPARLALQRKHAAEALDISVEHVDRYVRERVPCVYVGSLRLWPVSEPERFLAEHADPAMMDPTTKAPPRRANGRGHGNRKVGS